MSYSSRVYRQRNPKVQDEKKGKFFSPIKGTDQKGKSSDAFFLSRKEVNSTPDSQAKEKEKEKPVQAKMADQEKEKEVNIPKQGDPLKEKERTVQKMDEDKNKDKEIKKKSEPVEEKDKDKETIK